MAGGGDGARGVRVLYCAGVGVSAWAGEAEDPVLRDAGGAGGVFGGGRGAGVVV
jgi:hypothetical protein